MVVGGVRPDDDVALVEGGEEPGAIELASRRQLQGLRLDHIDGLRDPLAYLQNRTVDWLFWIRITAMSAVR